MNKTDNKRNFYNNYKPRSGDFIVERGYSLISRTVRLLSKIRYGGEFKYVNSHVESFYDANTIVSADPEGVVLKSYKKGNSDFRIYRLKGMKGPKIGKHKEIASKYVGTGYAYSRYALDAVSILSFFVFLFFVLCSMSLILFPDQVLIPTLISGGIYILIQRIKPILKRYDLITMDCVEFLSTLYSENGLWIPLTDNSRNEFPDGMKQVLDNLVLSGNATIVYETESFGNPLGE